jgi:hypothetical protein
MRAMLNTDYTTGQCSNLAWFNISDSLESLTLIELHSNRQFKTIVNKATRFLYIGKLDKDNYDFYYSNKLLLPE